MILIDGLDVDVEIWWSV